MFISTLLLAALSFRVVRGDDNHYRYFSIGHGSFARTRLDPIVSPGQVSGHVHNVIGSSKFSASEEFADATGAECTTSKLQADKSNYWAPMMYYKWRNGTYSTIQGDGLIAYWKYTSHADQKYAVIPDDFRMIAGDVKRDYWDPDIPAHVAIQFMCVDPPEMGINPYIPTVECTTIRAQVCLKFLTSIHAYLPDNSHVAYPKDQYEGDVCPDGFVNIPKLFVEAWYHLHNLGSEAEWYPGCYMLANGDTHGFSLHADFLNGWPSGLLVDAYEQCPQLYGNYDVCPLLAASLDEDKASACVNSGQIVNEPVGLQTALPKLPGNTPEFNSSRDAKTGYPKQPDPAYVERSQVISVPANGEGSCQRGECTDYPSTGQSAIPTSEATSSGTTSTGTALASETSDSSATLSQTSSTGATSATNTISVADSGQLLATGATIMTVTVTETASDCQPSKRRMMKGH